MGECRPFHFPEGSALLVTGLTADVRCVEREGRNVQVLEADEISRSMAARNTESTENTYTSLFSSSGHVGGTLIHRLQYAHPDASLCLKGHTQPCQAAFTMNGSPKDTAAPGRTSPPPTFLVLFF